MSALKLRSSRGLLKCIWCAQMRKISDWPVQLASTMLSGSTVISSPLLPVPHCKEVNSASVSVVAFSYPSLRLTTLVPGAIFVFEANRSAFFPLARMNPLRLSFVDSGQRTERGSFVGRRLRGIILLEKRFLSRSSGRMTKRRSVWVDNAWACQGGISHMFQASSKGKAGETLQDWSHVPHQPVRRRVLLCIFDISSDTGLGANSTREPCGRSLGSSP